jgi:predicted phosphodiesterase
MISDVEDSIKHYLPKYRSIFISDTHLGSPHSNLKYLKDFLIKNDCKYLYLVGDIMLQDQI